MKKKQLKKLVAKTANEAADKALKADFYTQAVEAANKSAKKAAKTLYRRVPFGGDGGTVTPKRPGPYTGQATWRDDKVSGE
jgi:hypothetical protein